MVEPTKAQSQWWGLDTVERPRNMKIMVSLHWASILTKYLTDWDASWLRLPFTYCFMEMPQATMLEGREGGRWGGEGEGEGGRDQRQNGGEAEHLGSQVGHVGDDEHEHGGQDAHPGAESEGRRGR